MFENVCALRRGTNMAAVKQQKHLSLSFAIETKIFTLEASRAPIH